MMDNAVRIRPAEAADMKQVYQWRNDPWIVERGSLNRTVTKEEHEAWFQESLKSDVRQLFIVEIDGVRAGQIRFDLQNEGRCRVSLYVMQDYTGQGFGVEALTLGCQAIAKVWSVSFVVAEILPTNTSSQVAFRKAGFVQSDDVSAEDHLIFLLDLQAL